MIDERDDDTERLQALLAAGKPRGWANTMSRLDLERPVRVRAVYDVLLGDARERGEGVMDAIVKAVGGASETQRRSIGDVLRSHDAPGSTCTRHGTCLHSSWDIASQIVDVMSDLGDGPTEGNAKP